MTRGGEDTASEVVEFGVVFVGFFDGFFDVLERGFKLAEDVKDEGSDVEEGGVGVGEFVGGFEEFEGGEHGVVHGFGDGVGFGGEFFELHDGDAGAVEEGFHFGFVDAVSFVEVFERGVEVFGFGGEDALAEELVVLGGFFELGQLGHFLVVLQGFFDLVGADVTIGSVVVSHSFQEIRGLFLDDSG